MQESRIAILSGREEIKLSDEALKEARLAYQLSDERLKNNVPGSTPSEVLLGLQSLSLAQINYVNGIRTYNKAQLRLMVLLGASTAPK